MTTPGTVTASAGDIIALVARIFSSLGVDEAGARTVAEALVEADREGLASHGVMLTDMYVDRIRSGSVSPTATGTIVSDQGVTMIMDAENGLGQITGDKAIAHAIDRAKALGAGIVAVRNGFHFGAARRFALKAADAGCVGIVMCNTRPLMPAPGGAEPVVGNNPLAIAIPTASDAPIVLDMATSEAAMGKIRMAAKSGKQIPESWAVDAEGRETTDPEAAIAGMLLPSGGPKGFGLAFVMDLMAGLLSGGGYGATVSPLYGDPAKPYNCAHLFMAIDAAHFGDAGAMQQAAAEAGDKLRAGRKAPGVDRLYAPGEREWQRARDNAETVTITDTVAAMLAGIARTLEIEQALIAPLEQS